MARTPAQRGRIGNWLVESRLARGWGTQAEARAEIARLTGWRIPQSVYAEWESGRRTPSEANVERLTSFYGEQPVASVGTTDAAAIVAAIDRLTDRLERVEDRLGGTLDGMADGLLDLLARLTAERAGTAVAREPLPSAKR